MTIDEMMSRLDALRTKIGGDAMVSIVDTNGCITCSACECEENRVDEQYADVESVEYVVSEINEKGEGLAQVLLRFSL